MGHRLSCYRFELLRAQVTQRTIAGKPEGLIPSKFDSHHGPVPLHRHRRVPWRKGPLPPSCLHDPTTILNILVQPSVPAKKSKMPLLPRRAPFYALALAPPLWLMTVGPKAADPPGKSSYLHVFGIVSGVLSALSWIWIAVLLGFSNSKPTIPHLLARSSVHITSFISLTLLWLGLGIMLATQTAIECQQHTGRCSLGMFSTALALLTSFFSSICAIIVYIAVVSSGSAFSTHVAQARHLALTIDEVES